MHGYATALTLNKIILATVFLLVLSACVTLPPPQGPQNSQSAAIGISLVIRPPFRQFGLADRIRLFGLADQKTDMTVYFIRLDEEKGTPNSFLQTTLYRSNYTYGNQVYLLNATPGRYAAVVVFFERTPPPPPPAPGAPLVASGPPKEFWTYLSEDVIRHTEVTVPPGAIRYMGDFVIDQAVGMKNADEAQDHYHRFVIYSHDKMLGDFLKGMEKGLEAMGGTILYYSIADPASLSTLNLMARVLLFGEVSYPGSAHSVDQSPQAEAAFLKKAGEQFQPTGWMPSIHKRLDELSAP
jgi:hypothetical protein